MIEVTLINYSCNKNGLKIRFKVLVKLHSNCLCFKKFSTSLLFGKRNIFVLKQGSTLDAFNF